MAVTRFCGAEPHRNDSYSTPGTHVVITAHDDAVYPGRCDNGIYCNSGLMNTSITDILDIGGNATPFTYTVTSGAWTGNGSSSAPDDYGYDLAIGAYAINDRYTYHSNSAPVVIKIDGFQANELCDIGLMGWRGTGGTRGGIYRIPEQGEAEVVNSYDAGNETGMVMFRDIVPSDGSFNLEIHMITDYVYVNFIHLIAKRR